ncbi:MAG: hypothetical protein ABJF11_04975 [Reichenbachiella sp.]
MIASIIILTFLMSLYIGAMKYNHDQETKSDLPGNTPYRSY